MTPPACVYDQYRVDVYMGTHLSTQEIDHWQDMKVAQHLNTQVFLSVGSDHKSSFFAMSRSIRYQNIKLSIYYYSEFAY